MHASQVTSTATDDLYTILGISEDAADDEIRRSYKRLAKELHPDRFIGDAEAQEEAQERFAKVSNAYNVLKDRTARSEYDFERKMQRQRGLDEGIEVVEAPVEETGYKREVGDRKYREALQLQTEGDLQHAIEAVKEAAELCPNVAQYHALLGALYDKRGWHSYAKAELEAALRLAPADPVAKKLYQKVVGVPSEQAEHEARSGKTQTKGKRKKKGKRGKAKSTRSAKAAALKGTQRFRKKRAGFWATLLGKLLGRFGRE